LLLSCPILRAGRLIQRMADAVNALGARELESAVNPPELWKQHEERTGGMVRTRFPPEPNGYLHIGHAKSMNMNFKGAFEKLGVPPEKRETVFRYDDTNPAAESQEYIDSLREDVEWLGWKPVKTTHSSDSFSKLHAFAVQLIKDGLAYVCHQSKAEISASRDIAKARQLDPTLSGPGPESPWRERPVEENLALFEDMRRGKFAENAATLRLKMDWSSPNPNMWDFIAYRIRYLPHPHAGEEWCIYPTYDFTHCIIDSLEDIDYSICTLEFETRRESYYWLLQALGIYRPKVYEFSRLNITYTVLSKRKLLKLVQSGTVRGWDDPRMPTIKGLRRRGYLPEILNRFCEDIGVSRTENVVEHERLQQVARLHLNESTKRVMAVLSPVKVLITNLGAQRLLDVPDKPQDPSCGATHKVLLCENIFIDAADFREVDSSDYYGLAPGKMVGLRYAGIMRCDEVVKGEGGETKMLKCSLMEGVDRPKGVITWVPQEGSLRCELRLYNNLFTVPNPDENWEAQLNPESEVVVSGAFVDPSVMLGEPSVGTSFQFERQGFFALDKDTDPTNGKFVFNRVETLKEGGIKKQPGKSRKDELEANIAAKEARKSIPPQELFRSEASKYSKFDDDGIPTHDAAGEPMSKSSFKKLKKEWEKHKKLYEKAQKEKQAS
ncbi:unnamed protein product, partial [Chrysoparadoxa australica]